jgi:hypothetical protein
MRINIPSNADELLALAKLISEQHSALGDESPLKVLNWNENIKLINDAIKIQKEAEALAREAEVKYSERDKLLKSIDNIVKQSRDFLKAVYRNEPKKLGKFGFEVNEAPRPKKKTNEKEQP